MSADAVGGSAADPVALARSFRDALQDDRLDEAEQFHIALCEALPEASELFVFPVLLSIQRGEVLEALQTLSTDPEDRHPELRALCLHLIGDPSWEGLAQALAEDSSDPAVRRAMSELLCRPSE